MYSLTHMNFATLILDGSAIILSLCILHQIRFIRKTGRIAEKLFLGILVTIMVMAVADIGGYLTENRPDPALIVLQIISMTLYYVSATVLCVAWYDYCTFKFKNAQRRISFGFKPAFIPGIALVVLLLVNVSAGFIFSVDGAGGYHRGILYIPMYFVFMGYIVLSFVMIGRYRTAEKRKLIPLGLYLMPILVTTVTTFVSGEVSMAPLGAAISVSFTHLGTMNEVAEISLRETEIQ